MLRRRRAAANRRSRVTSSRRVGRLFSSFRRARRAALSVDFAVLPVTFVPFNSTSAPLLTPALIGLTVPRTRSVNDSPESTPVPAAHKPAPAPATPKSTPASAAHGPAAPARAQTAPTGKSAPASAARVSTPRRVRPTAEARAARAARGRAASGDV